MSWNHTAECLRIMENVVPKLLGCQGFPSLVYKLRLAVYERPVRCIVLKLSLRLHSHAENSYGWMCANRCCSWAYPMQWQAAVGYSDLWQRASSYDPCKPLTACYCIGWAQPSQLFQPQGFAHPMRMGSYSIELQYKPFAAKTRNGIQRFYSASCNFSL